MINRIQFCFILLLVISCAPGKGDEHAPEASLADLKIHEGLEVKLFASEPLFTNPTNIAIDAKGRVWVCEAYNYRNQLNPKNPEKKEGDRIMILEDTDGDGHADKSKVFYQGTDVNAALGILVIGKKVIVSCSPNVFVFTDENGDDIPEKKEILFKGVHGNQHDHGMHTFVFGSDGKLYFNFGNEGKCLLTASGDTVVDVRGRKVVANGKPFREGMVMRCNLDGTGVEVLANNFRNMFEVTIDPYGNIWQSDNDDDGNKGTRINYVMEGGNYGYKDEMTGAGWNSRRTNMEKEIPFRHWHLNDPGVIPNMLQTGSGSPSGIAFYEGSMLPEVFRGQLIHAEPGHNVVRAYPTKKENAGFTATIVPILEGQKDQWFRPVDVAVAPDGSVMVADWYDPGVGGHQVGDLDRGRIYRVAAPHANYTIPVLDVSTSDGAVNALLNANMDMRYQGWMALQQMGEKAKEALVKVWKSSTPPSRAQVLWLLAKLPDGKNYLNEAFHDANPDIVVTALRAYRASGADVLLVVDLLMNHPSAEVRREVVLALRDNHSAAAAMRWGQLAMLHDGKDRWYLEALGIAASGREDQCLEAWMKLAGNEWNTAAGRDILWRSRSESALPRLGEIILKSNEIDMLRYYRAFDFHQGKKKNEVLSNLAIQAKGEKVLFALKHMEAGGNDISAPVRRALNTVLNESKGKLEFVELVSRFKLEERAPDLLALTLQYPDSVIGKESMKAMLDWGHLEVIEKVIQSRRKEEVQSVVKATWPYVYDAKAMALMERIMMDTTQDMENRKLAVRTFGGPWESEDRLVSLAEKQKIPADLQVAAAGVFQSAWRSSVREAGAKWLKLPGSKEGHALPAISQLTDRSGNIQNGKVVFGNTCSNCHRVNGQGVNFGPDLSEIGSKLSKEAIYGAILFPDQGISFGFEGYSFLMKNGSTAVGMVVSETADKVEIHYMNSQQTLHAADIQSRTKLTSSLMPSNLQSLMTEAELVDLVEYLSSLRTK